MDKALHELSASELRKLLLVNVQDFVKSLDNSSLVDLQISKKYLSEIVHLISIKEEQEKRQPEWGKDSTIYPVFAQPDGLGTMKA